MGMRWISLVSMLSLALAGCGASQAKAGDAPNLSPLVSKETEILSTPSPAVPTQKDDMPKVPPLSAVPPQWDDMPKDPPLPYAANPGPQALIKSAKADLAERLSTSATQIKTLETKEVVWPDASFGCPKPGINYAQIPTPGYLIILVHAGNEFEYHADTHGNTLYCENPTPPISGTPADNNSFRIAPP